MNCKDFTNKLIDLYQNKNNQELSYEALGPFLCEIIDSSADIYKMPLRRNTMARVLHEFYKNVLKVKDLDWRDAGKFPDIYDCKLCANPLAQCYVRGLIKPRKEGNVLILGANDIVTNEEIIYIFSLI
ncbi:hypothetical protein SAMN04487928_11156 [Butyrivibrio proteoclasticus]|uniref:Uncharacterized protein n=1 Tax=Butyrivibrio proteoclasticus TaxID=43305 RepID=A0A1I5U484_9FIRM|nr:hypothetical protein [Butyrivibrio proteoclasticus]SFP90105.1 hypothetical protein SAMN04487928_11156 [Butyrivibrio proteoclasticus]